nr:MAG TPA: hypothetical protein [Caudoviricetes sp.]
MTNNKNSRFNSTLYYAFCISRHFLPIYLDTTEHIAFCSVFIVR